MGLNLGRFAPVSTETGRITEIVKLIPGRLPDGMGDLRIVDVGVRAAEPAPSADETAAVEVVHLAGDKTVVSVSVQQVGIDYVDARPLRPECAERAVLR